MANDEAYDPNTTCPQTVEELFAWFEGTRDQRQLKLLVNRMLASGNYRIPEIWNRVVEMDLVDPEARWGWIDRDGKVWGCTFAAHERLLRYLGVNVEDAEKRGWVRFSHDDYQCLRRLSEAQKDTLRRKGISLDE